MPPPPGEIPKLTDVRVLRGFAHPLRSRILEEMVAGGAMRAADVAERLGIPANHASFHLRQLAKYGLVNEAPELARDGRDRVWRLVHEGGLRINITEVSASDVRLVGMAGAMDRPRRPYGSIADRIVATSAQGPSWLTPPADVDRTPLERLRHCYVTADEHGKVPALLLEWRETPDGWQGRVVRPVLDKYGEWRPREEWLPATQLAQA